MIRALSTVAAAAALLLCGATQAQVQRTFVASYGNDTNTGANCSFVTPCRSFAAAQTVTSSGGEIIAIDAAGYGAIAINRSISILANPGAYAGISASTGSAVSIATPGVDVRLVGLKLNGLGASSGISMTAGSSLTVEGCTVTGFTTHGIVVNTPARVRIVATTSADNVIDGINIGAGATADVVRTNTFGNGRGGIIAEAFTAVTTSVAVTDAVSSQNQFGFGTNSSSNPLAMAKLVVSGSSASHNSGSGLLSGAAAPSQALIVLGSSMVTRNDMGLSNVGAVFRSAGDNMVLHNNFNTNGVITGIGRM